MFELPREVIFLLFDGIKFSSSTEVISLFESGCNARKGS